ncbi:hypothetical protein F5148DRAFT_788931 [Russula earlei]|uniref:Uncharacterized protein n=1 Tax=Russula earlei TaxID=71964 RepID=A0ACC0TTT2_9AGAM|nr:hypothetical protein F5148DRAFT_788931 [Russula earlei]
MSEIQDVWPVLPLAIRRRLNVSNSWKNIAAVLESEHHHRICEIEFAGIPMSRWERFAAAMQKPFPGLTCLQFCVSKNTVLFLPDSFLGGSAPLLRELWLANCPFQDCRNHFFLPINLSFFPFGIFPTLVTFLPRIWAPPFRSCPDLKTFALLSNPVYIRQVDHLRSHVLSSPLSLFLLSTAFTSTWRTYWPNSRLPFSISTT